MLGWFKKKFGKQAQEAPAPEPIENREDVADRLEEGVKSDADTAASLPDSASAKEAEPVDSLDLGRASAEVVQEDTGSEVIEVVTEIVVEKEKPLVDDGLAPLPDSRIEAADEATVMESAGLGEEAQDADLHRETGSEDATDQPPIPPEPEVGADLAPTVSREPAMITKSMFQRLQERLGKTRDALVFRLDRLFLGKKEIDQDLFDQLEEILITADLGVATTMELLDKARNRVKRDQLSDPQALKTILRNQLLAYIEAADQPAELVMPAEGPFVIMVVGVNGVGKTTTIGKMAAKFTRAGQSVLLVAGDTFRAAAINQLKIWGERVGVEVFARQPGDDPSSVAFDSLEYGCAHNHDVIIMDTAGRLHTSVNLMEELKKIKRVIGKKLAGAPHEVMLVLDATTGQNGVSQARLFHEAVGVSGLALTKLDGTAKGGIIANVCREVKIPVRFIGIGEQIDDLRDFDAREFVDALFDHRA
jgi:fused signal recognition particle receptor